MSWPIVKLGDICRFEYGKNLPSSDRIAGEFQVFGSNGPVGDHNSGFTKGKTVVVGRKGSIGEAVFSSKSCWPIDTTYYVDEAGTDQDIRWLYYLIQSLNLRRFNKATGVPSLNRADAYKCKIMLPPLEEQKRIAGILDQADALRCLRARALEKLNTLGQAVFQEAFGDPATNPRSLPKLRIASAVSKISDGPFGSNLKSEHYTDAGVRVWRLQNITARGIDNSDQAFISEEHYNTISKHTCFPGDVIVATLGDPNLRACIQPSSVSRAINKADCVQIRPNNDVAIAEFWEGLINHPGMIALSHSEIQGQTRARISMGRLRKICVPIPDIEDQYIYRDRVAGISILISKADEAVKESNALFASLQSAAFQGRL